MPLAASVLLYDGACAACHAAVRFVLTRDRRGTMCFAARESAYGRAVLHRHPALAGVDSLVLVETDGGGERVRIKSDAVLEIARYLGGLYRLALGLRVVPRWLRDAMYDAFARNRYRLVGPADACVVPTTEARRRFLDGDPGLP